MTVYSRLTGITQSNWSHSIVEPDANCQIGKENERLDLRESVPFKRSERNVQVQSYQVTNASEQNSQHIAIEEFAIDPSLIEPDSIIKLYFKEAAQTPLLTAIEEVTLAKQIEKGRAAERKLARVAGDDDEVRTLKSQISAGQQARDHLITANTRLVISIAKKYRGRGVPFSDLIQEGNLGLIKAVEKFEYRRGHRFSTYAIWWIKQAVGRAVIDQGRSIRLPVHLGEKVFKLGQISGQLEQKLGRKPTIEDLAVETGLEISQVHWLLRVSQHVTCLEQPIGEEGSSTFSELIEDEDTIAPPDATDNQVLRTKIEDALATLTPREAKILRLRFGLEDGQNHILEEIGKRFGLTRERIRQLECLALDKLRRSHYCQELKDFLA